VCGGFFVGRKPENQERRKPENQKTRKPERSRSVDEGTPVQDPIFGCASLLDITSILKTLPL
jgi:hypothetical protein